MREERLITRGAAVREFPAEEASVQAVMATRDAGAETAVEMRREAAVQAELGDSEPEPDSTSMDDAEALNLEPRGAVPGTGELHRSTWSDSYLLPDYYFRTLRTSRKIAGTPVLEPTSPGSVRAGKRATIVSGVVPEDTP